MKIRKALAAGFAATMLLAACGGGSDREDLLKSLEEDLDATEEQKACVKDFTDKFSDDELADIRKEVDNEDVNFEDVSAQSQDFMNGVMSCMTSGDSALLDQVMAGLPEDIPEDVRECIREEFTGIDAAQLSELENDPAAAQDLVMDCMTG